MRTTYIFHVFNTLLPEHIGLAFESLRRQNWVEALSFVLYNSSAMSSTVLLDQAQTILGDRFLAYTAVTPRQPTNTTLADIQEQLARISGADFYILHKADFLIGRHLVQRLMDSYSPAPMFLNCVKFDLRETVVDPLALVGRSWENVLTDEDAVDLTEYKGDGNLRRYTKLGYRGWDGVMHAYTEAARQKMVMDTFIQWSTVQNNQDRGIAWNYGDPSLLTFHQFHALPGGRGDVNKDAPGMRY